MPSAGTPAERGYGYRHRETRRRWEQRVRAGGVTCWRCRQAISPDDPWDLGHDDHDRTRYRGPEHRHCNRSAGGQAKRRGSWQVPQW